MLTTLITLQFARKCRFTNGAGYSIATAGLFRDKIELLETRLLKCNDAN